MLFFKGGVQLKEINECANMGKSVPKIESSMCTVKQGSHRLEKYLNIQDCLEKSSKIKFALKST